MQIEELRTTLLKLLANYFVRVDFRKADGTIRSMICTLNKKLLSDILGENNSTSDRASNPATISCFDLEKMDWRSFRVDSVLNFTTYVVLDSNEGPM